MESKHCELDTKINYNSCIFKQVRIYDLVAPLAFILSTSMRKQH